MGFIDKIKEFYFELEDGYYELLDKIDKVVPVYKIIDPIDRVIPSYPIVALLCLLVLFLVLNWGLTAFFQGANASLTVRVLDSEESVLPSILVNASFPDGKTDSKTTNDFGEALLTVPKGAKITLTVGGEGYKSQTQEVEVTDSEQAVSVTLEKEGAAEGAHTRTLRFVNAVGQPVSDELHVEFTCKSPYAKAPEPMTVTGGRATVEEPPGCGQLIVAVTDSTDWETLSSVAVDQDVKTVYLQGAAVEAGRIIVNLASKGQPVSGVDVELYRYDDIVANGEVGPIDSTIAYDGQATFNKPQGTYLVKAYDAGGGYGEARSEKITVRAGETATVSLELANNVKGKIALKILDKATKKPIEGARVTLRYAADDSELKTLESGADGIVAFNISDDVEYRVSVDKDGYVLEKVASARLSAATAEILLEKCTEAKCGLLTVQVVDEDNIPVSNATVALYLPETNFTAGYENKVSDVNGFAKFAGVKAGLYYAFAFREFGAGRSNDFRFGGGLGQGGVDATVTMQVGNGTLMVYAVNQDNEPIPFTMVDVYSTLSGGKIGSSFTDANGVLSIDTKADKEIYVRASKEGYSPYVSASRKISSGGLTRFVALMEPKIIERGAEIRFLGLYKGERVATSLAAGEEYTGRWQLRIPEALPYRQAGIHIRTGDELIMEKDSFYIEGVNAPGAAIVKSTAYDARSGYDQSTYDYTFGDAKWLNAVWSNPKPGIYELEATIQVRKTASVGDELNLYYRSWAVDGAVVRDPADDYIETNELYNNAYKQTYQIGASTLCDQDFCFDVSIRDLEQDVLENVVDTYQAQVFTEYEAVFTLTNNSKSAYHTNANLRISNPDQSLVFLDYTINDADGRPRVGRVNGPEFPRLDIGNLAPNKRVTGKFRFSTQRAINGVINFRLVSDQQIAFDRFINVAVAATKQLNILTERNTFSSGIENDLVFTVVDLSTNLEVPSVTCRLKDKRGNLIARAITDPQGRVVIRVPAQLPGTLLVLECEKEKFDHKEIEINITLNIIEIQPAEISITLNSKTKTEAEVAFHVKNLANFPLKISSIDLLGDFKNLLDEQQIRNWLVSNYKDFVIQPGQTLDATLKVFLSDDGKALINRADLNGKLFVNVTNFGQDWSFETPARIGIGLTGDVDTPGCLTVTRDKWQTTTEGNPVNVEFQIQNNCLINGIPVPLKRLQAQIALQGNQLGEYKLTVGSTEVELRSTYGRTIVGEISPGETINAILTFTPYGGTLGEAKADLLLTARNPKEENDQFLENKMNTEIAIINIKDCVSIDRHLVVMPEKGNGSFTITTKKCGGKTSFQLESDLELSVKEFVLDGDGSQQVQVFAGEELPGQYGVLVKSKAQNENQEQLIRNVRVRVDSTGCLSLSRYEFDVLDQASDPFDGVDNAQLINKCVEKEITIKVDMRDLGEALKEGAIWGGIVLGLGLLGDFLKGQGVGTQCTVDSDCPNPNDICRGGKCVARTAGGGGGVTLKSNLGTVNGYSNVYLGSDGCHYQVLNGQNVALPANLQPPGCVPGAGGGTSGCTTGRCPNATGAPGPAGPPGVASPPAAPGAAPAVVAPGAAIDWAGVRERAPPRLDNQYPVVYSTKTQQYYQHVGTAWYDKTGNQVACDTGCGSHPLTPPGTTMADLFTLTPAFTQPSSPTGFASLFGGTPGAGGSAFGGVGSLLSTGIGAATGQYGPIGQAITVFLGVAMANYFGQDEEKPFRTIQTDVEIQDIALYPNNAPNQTTQDTDVEVTQELDEDGEPVIVSSHDPEKKDTCDLVEKRQLLFKNLTAFTTEPNSPKVKYLTVKATQHNYNEDHVYDIGDFGDDGPENFEDGLKEKEATPATQKFRLQFNAVPPETNISYNPALLNCQSGVRTGRTGPQALPKVKLDWTWSAINENDCDTDNAGAVFCDGTQFSIALLKKIRALDQYLQANSPFTCPTAIEPFSTKTAIIGAKDIGISRLAANRVNNDYNVAIEITNNNPAEVETQAKAYAIEIVSGKTYKCSPQTINVKVNQVANVNCTLSGLPNGTYRLRADLLPNLACPGCQNNPASDNLEVGFVVGGAPGLELCNPRSTSRLEDFLAASGLVGGAHANALKLVSFKANLIKDRYTADFQRDFDDFSRTESFFDAPSYYTDPQIGLGRYFANTDRFAFKPRFGQYNPEGYLLPGPGIYEVTLDITYDGNSTWRLFDGNKLTAKVEVLLDRLDSPEPDNPFYHLPFDGLIGVRNGRVGYGVNYKGDRIRINSESEALFTVEIAGSTPVQNGVIEVFDKTDDFKRLNIDRRGTILEVSRGATNQFTYSPSYATPLLLRIGNANDEAWAFYSLSVGDAAVNVGPSSSKWNGIGYNCTSFDDRRMIEAFYETPDQHGLETACALLGGDIAATSYGFEFCKPLKYGNVFLKTIYYTPQNKSSKVQLDVANDEGEFITQAVSGSLVPLNGVQGIPFNQLSGSQIGSIEDIFSLVRDEYVCVSGTDARADFWWNPKKVMDTVLQKEDAAQQACIGAG